jgi:hypothetical protein
MKQELQVEQASVEIVTNIFILNKVSLGASHKKIFDFYFKSLLYNKFDCALSLYELINIVDVLYLTSRIILDYPF